MIEPGATAPDFELPDQDGRPDKQGLNFTLLADDDHSVADGNVAHVIPKVSPKTHDDQALAALANLREAA